jgi:hypothetical protein
MYFLRTLSFHDVACTQAPWAALGAAHQQQFVHERDEHGASRLRSTFVCSEPCGAEACTPTAVQ